MKLIFDQHLPTSVGGHSTFFKKSLQKKLSLLIRIFPIIFFITYLSFTVFLFAKGPWLWPIRDGTKLYSFLAFAHLALFLGYLSASFQNPKGYFGKWNIKRIMKVTLIFNLLLIIPTTISRTGSMFPDVAYGFTNPGNAYMLHGFHHQEGSRIIEYIRILFGPLLFIILPLTVFYWKQLKPIIRLLSSLCIIASVSIFISMGTNKGFADAVLLIPWIVLARHLSGYLRLKLRHLTITIMALAIAFSIFLLFFTRTQLSRPGSATKTAYFAQIDMHADLNNPIVRYLPQELEVLILSLSCYITQGYYGLYSSLEVPYLPMFGVGNSMFSYRQAARITGNEEIMYLPYPTRISEFGWDAYGNWSTIYPWIASDVSFPGTILVVFLIGRLFALSWLDTLKGSNPFAVAMFAQFLIMLFYFPANNQCMQSGEGFTAFWGILILWLFTRHKYSLRARSK